MQAVIKEFICSSTNAPSVSPRGHLRCEHLGVDGALYPARSGRVGGPRDREGGASIARSVGLLMAPAIACSLGNFRTVHKY